MAYRLHVQFATDHGVDDLNAAMGTLGHGSALFAQLTDGHNSTIVDHLHVGPVSVFVDPASDTNTPSYIVPLRFETREVTMPSALMQLAQRFGVYHQVQMLRPNLFTDAEIFLRVAAEHPGLFKVWDADNQTHHWDGVRIDGVDHFDLADVDAWLHEQAGVEFDGTIDQLVVDRINASLAR